MFIMGFGNSIGRIGIRAWASRHADCLQLSASVYAVLYKPSELGILGV